MRPSIRKFIFLGALLLALAACAPVAPAPQTEMPTAVLPGTGQGTATAQAPEPTATQVTVPTAGPSTSTPLPTATSAPQATAQPSPQATRPSFDSRSQLSAALTAAGASVEEGLTIDQPFFPVQGQILRVNGQDVQVFEFADEAARKASSDLIGENGDVIGTFKPSWISTPHFWASGRLIVLYVGQDEQALGVLNTVLGEPLAEPSQVGGGIPPAAALEAQRFLSQTLNVNIENIDFVSFRQEQWPDSCLGAGQPNESCAQVVTPGWSVVLAVNGTNYEVRTNETGSVVRIVQR